MSLTERLSYLPRSDNLVLRRSQLGQRERPTTMKLLSADAHLGSEAELRAIGEAGRCVPVHRGRIDSAQEFTGIRFVARHDGVGMLCGISIDVGNRFVHVRD